MIIYDGNQIHSFVCKCYGSTIPRAVLYTAPSFLFAVGSHYLLENFGEFFKWLDDVNKSVIWSALVIVLGVLLAVRTNKAYERFWEGITLVQQMRAEWFETASNLIAFSMVASKKDARMTQPVLKFQMVLVRLMSLMHGSALRQIGGEKEDFDVLDLQALDHESLRYLTDCELSDVNRVEVLLHWIQVLVTDSAEDGVIVVAPPILTRAYQTLSRGMVNLHNARKLADVPFPFPLSQTIVVMLLVQSIMTPFFVATVVNNALAAAIISFIPIFGMWSVTFIAGELEQPFGSDPNDLPLSVLQHDFNMTLLMLLDEEATRPPDLIQEQTQTVLELRRSLSEKDPFSTTNTVSSRGPSKFSQFAIDIEDTPAKNTTRTHKTHKSLLAQKKEKSRRVSTHMMQKMNSEPTMSMHQMQTPDPDPIVSMQSHAFFSHGTLTKDSELLDLISLEQKSGVRNNDSHHSDDDRIGTHQNGERCLTDLSISSLHALGDASQLSQQLDGRSSDPPDLNALPQVSSELRTHASGFGGATKPRTHSDEHTRDGIFLLAIQPKTPLPVVTPREEGEDERLAIHAISPHVEAR